MDPAANAGCYVHTSAFLAWCRPPAQLTAISHRPSLRRTCDEPPLNTSLQLVQCIGLVKIWADGWLGIGIHRGRQSIAEFPSESKP